MPLLLKETLLEVTKGSALDYIHYLDERYITCTLFLRSYRLILSNLPFDFHGLFSLLHASVILKSEKI